MADDDLAQPTWRDLKVFGERAMRAGSPGRRGGSPLRVRMGRIGERSGRRAAAAVPLSPVDGGVGVRIELVTGDIAAQRVDAIVNAANSSLLGGGGVDGAIHRKGGPEILAACRALRAGHYGGGLPAGQAVATTAGLLPARWVIHTVGPVFSATEDRSGVLRDCYANALRVADEVEARSVAFPLISSGAYRWPVRDAVVQALAALRGASTAVREVTLVLFDDATRQIADGVR